MREKIHSYFGFCKRSRNLISGYNSCIYGIERKKICLLILAEDLSINTVDKLKKLAVLHGIPLRIYSTKKNLSMMTGENDRGIFGITDKNLAAAIMEEIDRYGQNGL